jgi:hypothetical protein
VLKKVSFGEWPPDAFETFGTTHPMTKYHIPEDQHPQPEGSLECSKALIMNPTLSQLNPFLILRYGKH